MKPPFSMLTEDQRRKAINVIIAYFQDERGEEIGIIAAESLLETLLEELGKPIYNKAVADTKRLLNEKVADLQLDIDALAKD